MSNFEFRTPGHIVFGAGCIKEISTKVTAISTGKRIFLVTDKGVVGAGLVPPVEVALRENGFEVFTFSDVIADPSEEVILSAVAQAKDFDTDIVIGLGGGSSMDAAKLVAILMSGTQNLRDIYGVDAVKGTREVPLILAPTTAGTGSEVTPISIVTTGQSTKMGVVSPQLYADMALLDPELTRGLPAAATAATGIDAMVHAIEAYTSKHKKNPISDQLARSALALLSSSLLPAVRDGDDLSARADMLLGAMQAGQAFANAPVAAIHALAYPLGSIFHIAHGLSNALVMPHVLKFNLSRATPLYAELARVVSPSVSGSDKELAVQFIDFMEQIRADTGIEQTLRDVGVQKADIDRLADDAMLQTRLLINNPREVERKDAFEIYKAAY